MMMSERFKLRVICGGFGLIDNNKWEDLHPMSENSLKNLEICITKMNALADENEKLKETNKRLRATVNEIYRIARWEGR